TLGKHWNPRLIVIPDAPLVHGGPYRFLHHPNYTAVAVEVAALAAVNTIAVTHAECTSGNAAVLSVRIRAENRASGLVK
ncbi:hypothetical protein C6A85_70310, partial [Mycobacterium sp. ITM-2017-0098]